MYDCIVIGAGNGGLVGALNLAKAGKKVLLLEKHIVPGGAGSSFVRGRFEFDTGLHTLWGIGTKEKPGRLGKLFQELGVYDKIEFVQQDELFRLAVPFGLGLSISNQKEDFLKKVKLLSFSRKQAKGIEQYQKLLDGLEEEFFRLYDHLGEEVTEKDFPLFFKYGVRNATDVMDEYFTAKVPRLLYGMIGAYQGFPIDMEGMPLVVDAFLYGLDGATHVKNGAQSISNALLDEFENCGGTALFHAEVDHISVEDGKVTGVRLRDGRTFEAERVLCNANKVRAYVEYIDEKWVPEEKFQELKLAQPSITPSSIYFGLDCSAEELGIKHGISFMMDPRKPEKGKRNDIPLVEQFGNMAYMSCYNVDDRDYSKPGTCVLSILTEMVYDDWRKLSPEEYIRVKDSLTEQCADFLSGFFPNIKEHIEVAEASTPLTVERFLGAPKGTIYASAVTVPELLTNKMEADSVIGGLYFCGASIITGGFNTTYTSGKAVSDLMLKRWAKGEL